MKTTAKLGLLAVAFLLMLAGCTNSISPSGSETAIKKSEVGEKRKFGGGNYSPLTVTGATSSARYSDGSGYNITLTFSQPVDIESVKKAVHVRKLQELTAEGNPKLGDQLTLKWDVAGQDVSTLDPNNTKTLTFKVETKDPVAVYLSVKSDTLKVAGLDQYLDQDKDGVDKESAEDYTGDDDRNGVLGLGVEIADTFSTTPTPGTVYVGKTKYLYGMYSDRQQLSNLFTASVVSFEEALKADLTTDYDLGNLVTYIVVNNKGNSYLPGGTSEYNLRSVETFGISNELFGDLLKKHLVVEQKVGLEWKKVDANFTYTGKDHAQKPYCWVAKIDVNPRTAVRARLQDVFGMKVEAGKSSRYSYELRYTTEDGTKDFKEGGEPTARVIPQTYTGVKRGEPSFYADTTLDATRDDTAGTVTLGFTLPSISLRQAKHSDGHFYDVYRKHEGNSIVGNFTGFDKDTIKPENFRFNEGAMITTWGTRIYAKAYSWNDPYTGKPLEASCKLTQYLANSIVPTVTATALAQKADTNHMKVAYGDAHNAVVLSYQKPAVSALTAGDFYSLLKAFAADENADYQNNLLIAEFFNSVKDARSLVATGETDAVRNTRAKAVVKNAIKEMLAETSDKFAEGASVNWSADPTTTFSHFDSVYVSPAVKITAFTGEYTVGPNTFDAPVPACTFARYGSGDSLQKEGWCKKSF